eukprot:TRINITY_DN2573_c0_g1_i2.p1 TRINITY_DN2573_c0_g1~~TRINITY_DN2573_c0_g1_i2.p1  ORF type:complete len:204 (+),score=12.43 TRINITY_DN2573_c0_g1_i2:70-681(+)
MACMTGLVESSAFLTQRTSFLRSPRRIPRVIASAEGGRRDVLRLLATSVTLGFAAKKALADARPIKLEKGGKQAVQLADEARDLKLPLKERFYLQPLTADEAKARAKESANDIIKVKELIDKKAWPYVQNDLRLRAEYLRYDLNTVINSKPKDQKKPLKDLTAKLFDSINNLDYAARNKSTPNAEKYYAETVTALNNVLSNLG